MSGGLKMRQLTVYCYWRPPDTMLLLTENAFGAPGDQRSNFDNFIYIHYTAPYYCLPSAPFKSSHFAKFGWAPFADLRVQRQQSRTQTLQRVGEICDPIFTRLWTKVLEIFTRLSMSRFVQKIFAIKVPDRRSKFLVRETRTRNLVQETWTCVIISRTSFFSYEKLGSSVRGLSLEIVEKLNTCKSFLAPIFLGETTSTFLRQIVSDLVSIV